MKKNASYNHVYELCKNHMHSYVLAEMTDGTKLDGIITGLDEENVYFAIPLSGEEQAMGSNYNRQYWGGGYSGYGSPGYGSPGYGSYGYYPPRRFGRFTLPLVALATLSLLPWY